MLVPSQKLLLRWMKDHRLLFELVYGDPANILLLKMDLPSPNSFLCGRRKTVDTVLRTFTRGRTSCTCFISTAGLTPFNLHKPPILLRSISEMNQHNRAEFVRISALWQEVFDRTNMRNRNSHDKTQETSISKVHFGASTGRSASSDDHNMCSLQLQKKCFLEDQDRMSSSSLRDSAMFRTSE